VRHPRLVALAAAASILHAAGLTLAATAMQPGTVLAGAEARTRWLAGRPAGWSIGWTVWILCALSLVALLAALNERLRAGGSLPGTVAVAVAAAGAAVDIFCDALWIGVIPDLAAGGPDRVFLAAERALAVGGTVAANGLYACAVLVFTRLLPRGAEWGLARLLGWVTALAGFGLCAAGLHGHAYGVALFSGLTISAFVFWAVALARAAEAAP
jgi:hypothetical protein